VERLAGPVVAKQRLRLILETLTGQRTIAEASACLGVSVRRFHLFRSQFLQAALHQLTPKPVGRPSRAALAADQRVSELQAEVRKLHIRLQAALVREEIALTMPHLFRRKTRKKRPGQARRIS
jgi:hypothetical protein